MAAATPAGLSARPKMFPHDQVNRNSPLSTGSHPIAVMCDASEFTTCSTAGLDRHHCTIFDLRSNSTESAVPVE
jgi:hypothetical protein